MLKITILHDDYLGCTLAIHNVVFSIECGVILKVSQKLMDLAPLLMLDDVQGVFKRCHNPFILVK